MSFFTFDENNVSTGFELIKEGPYEATINNAEVRVTQAGNKQLSVDFEIRGDVQQEHQGAKVLYNNFGFDHEVAVRILNSLIKACGFPNGTSFNSPEDLAQQLIGKNLEIIVKHETDYKNKDKKYAKAKYYNPSKLAATTSKTTEDELPF